jgi:hypothetical protein
MRKRSWLFEECVLKSWWTILFFLICFFTYDQAVKRQEREEHSLQKKLNQLITAKRAALEHQEELKRVIASEHDDAWIELVLMHKLGLVPEGETKVLFIRK